MIMKPSNKTNIKCKSRKEAIDYATKLYEDKERCRTIAECHKVYEVHFHDKFRHIALVQMWIDDGGELQTRIRISEPVAKGAKPSVESRMTALGL